METHPAALMRGFREFTAYYGMMLDTLAYSYVNGFAYTQPRPVAPEQAPERFARAAEVFEGKLWRDQLRDWDETFKPNSIRTHRELQAVDPDALSDQELIEYLTRCREHHREMMYQHMRFSGAAMVALGDLLAHVVEWTGVPPAELLSTMRGAAPVSAGAFGELERMIAAIRADPEAEALLASDGDPAATLEQLRALPGETGDAVDAYLDLTGYRLLDGFDISGRYALELPGALLRAIRASIESGGEHGSDFDPDAKVAEIRARVPEEHQAEFDEMFGEARLMYRIRDERGVFSDIWASGIMRRAALAGGRRLAQSGRIHDPEHIVDASFDEMCGLLGGADQPSADELAERAAWRNSHTAKDAPDHLGPPAPPPPDPSGLPPAAARMMRAAGFTMQAMFVPAQAPHEERLLRGLGASGGVYEGPARRVAGPEEFDRIEKGDVLVTASTSEAFNILLPLLGAIVTDTGGLLSHPAIVAREYGIPGVVGTRSATDQIADGVRVRVNGDKGEVAILE
jgi:pyruvate,water dikinase